MSLFGAALGTIVKRIHRAQGSPPITYTAAGAAPFALLGVFDSVGTVLDIATGTLQRTNEPRLGVVLADFAAPPLQGDAVAVAGVAYRVSDVELDGQGGAALILRRVF